MARESSEKTKQEKDPRTVETVSEDHVQTKQTLSYDAITNEMTSYPERLFEERIISGNDFPGFEKGGSSAVPTSETPISAPAASIGQDPEGETNNEKSEGREVQNRDAIIPISESDLNVASPTPPESSAFWGTGNFLRIPGARSDSQNSQLASSTEGYDRTYSLDSVYADSIYGRSLLGSGSFTEQRYGPNPLSHGWTQTLNMLHAPHNPRGGYGYSKEEQNEILLDIANRSHKDKKLVVQRFSRLANFCLLQYQHDLAKFEKKIVENKGKLDDNETQRVRALLLDYHMSVWAMSEISKIPRPSLADTRSFGKFMACRLHETHYWYSPDALNLFELKERSPESSPDPVRYFIQSWLPEWFLDQAGKDRRAIERKRRETGLKGGTAKIVEAFEFEPFPISPVTDRLARLVIGFIGCVFLLVPMTAMIFLPIGNIKVSSFIVTVVAVVLFAATMSLGTRATNQELLAATAAYTAVLVVFLGSAVTPPR